MRVVFATPTVIGYFTGKGGISAEGRERIIDAGEGHGDISSRRSKPWKVSLVGSRVLSGLCSIRFIFEIGELNALFASENESFDRISAIFVHDSACSVMLYQDRRSD